MIVLNAGFGQNVNHYNITVHISCIYIYHIYIGCICIYDLYTSMKNRSTLLGGPRSAGGTVDVPLKMRGGMARAL